jgi:hypothetical protein
MRGVPPPDRQIETGPSVDAAMSVSQCATEIAVASPLAATRLFARIVLTKYLPMKLDVGAFSARAPALRT